MDRGKGYEENRLITGIKLANLRIYEQAQQDPRCRGMGTTIVSTLFADRASDRRARRRQPVYRLRDGEIKQLTEDHSLLNDYIKMKRLTPEEIANFPHKNVIVRALGMKDTVKVDMRFEQRPRGRHLPALLRRPVGHGQGRGDARPSPTAEPDLDAMCAKLIGDANENGGARQHHRRRGPDRTGLSSSSADTTPVGVATASATSPVGDGSRPDHGALAPARPPPTRAPAPTTTSGPDHRAGFDDCARRSMRTGPIDPRAG